MHVTYLCIWTVFHSGSSWTCVALCVALTYPGPELAAGDRATKAWPYCGSPNFTPRACGPFKDEHEYRWGFAIYLSFMYEAGCP